MIMQRAAARARDGRIVTAVNAYRFTEGPCAEPVLIGAAAAQGTYDLDTIIALGDRDRGCPHVRPVPPSPSRLLPRPQGHRRRRRPSPNRPRHRPAARKLRVGRPSARRRVNHHSARAGTAGRQQGESPLMRPRSRTRRWSSSHILALVHAEKRRWAVASDRKSVV